MQGDFGAAFETPIHRYNALEVTADKRLSNRWALQASYRYSRLRGTYEGFYRDDNGQSDPGITSLFDFPTNDPSYTAIGVPQFGYRGDVRFLGAAGAGPLPLDRPHEFKAFGSYQFDMGLNVGAGLMVSSGKPLTALAANPVYNSPGEIPESVRGAGFDTIDGFLTRTPTQYDTAIHADYRLRVGRNEHVVAAGRRLQPVQPADTARLRSEHGDDVQGAESGLRAAEPLQPVAARDAAADQDWGAVPVLIEEILRLLPERR